MLACFLHRHRIKLISLSLVLLSIAIALAASSLIVSQNRILLNQSVLFVGILIGATVMLCCMLPQWVGLPFLVVLGMLIVFLAVQVFTFPSIHPRAISDTASLGTCIIQVDENNHRIAVLEPKPTHQKAYIPIHEAEGLLLEFTLVRSEDYYPLYGGGVWIILQACKAEDLRITFKNTEFTVFKENSAAARLAAAFFGFKQIRKAQFINLDELGMNSKHQIEWSKDRLLIRPL